MPKLKLQEVRLPNPSGPCTRTRYAIGQLVIYEDFDLKTVRDFWNVTHITSGCFIAKYYKLSDARTFAVQVQEVIDLDAYVLALTKGKLTPEWKQPLEDVRLLRESLPSYFPSYEDDDTSKRTELIEYLRGVVSAQ